MEQRCPLCDKFDDVGIIGSGRFYCSVCNCEFTFKKNITTIYKVTNNGGLIKLEKDCPLCDLKTNCISLDKYYCYNCNSELDDLAGKTAITVNCDKIKSRR